MKRPFSTAFLILLSAVLVIFGIFYGARQGWQAEANRIDALFSKDGGLQTMLVYRANDAANLEKVALRHIDASDETLSALKKSRDAAVNENASLHDRFIANGQLDTVAKAVEGILLGTLSFTQSQRDTEYVSVILRDMQMLSSSGAVDEYNAAARDFNNRINSSLSGLAARLLLIRPAQIFE